MRNKASNESIHEQASLLKRAASFAGLYAVLAGLWIVLSDAALARLVHDPGVLTLMQTLKGWLFIVITAVLLFTLLLREFRGNAEIAQRQARRGREMLALSQFRESVIDNASIWINVLDAQARLTVWNKAAERISGFQRGAVLGSSDIWELLYPDPEYRAYVDGKVSEILDHGLEVEGLETRIQCRDGSHKIISWNSRRFFDENADVGSIAIGLDVTGSKEAEQALQARERQLAILMANVPGMVYRCSHDEQRSMDFVSSGCLDLVGYTAQALTADDGISYASLMHPEDRDRVFTETAKSVAEGQAFAVEYRMRHHNGEDIWVWEQGRAVYGDGAMHLEGIIVNITDRKQMEQNLEQLAVRDPLTGLFNRREFALLLHKEIVRTERSQQAFALLWIDIDHFKAVNDQFGHLVGDEALKRVSKLITENIRGIDYVARYGGDEMVVTAPAMGSGEAMLMAERLQRMVQSAEILSQQDPATTLTISIGVAAYPEHGNTAEQLCEAADNAMYAAKQAGRNRVCSASTAAAPATKQAARKPRDN